MVRWERLGKCGGDGDYVHTGRRGGRTEVEQTLVAEGKYRRKNRPIWEETS